MEIADTVQPQIATLLVELHLPASQSLKSKRRVLKSLKDRIRSRFNVSVAEIGFLDKWQRAVLGICTLGMDKAYMDGILQKILLLIEHHGEAEITGQEIQFL